MAFKPNSLTNNVAAIALAGAGVLSSGAAQAAEPPKSETNKAFCRAVKIGDTVSANILNVGNPVPVYVLSTPKGSGDKFSGMAIDTKVMKPSSDKFDVDLKAKTCTVKGQTYEIK